MRTIKIKVGKTYQPEDQNAKPVTITGTCMSGIYKYVGRWGEEPEECDYYTENGMPLHVESEFDLISEIV